MYGWSNDNCFYNPVTCKEVSFSQTRENETDLSVCNLLSYLYISVSPITGPPIFLCLSKTFLSKYLFFDPSTHSLCEEILCSI